MSKSRLSSEAVDERPTLTDEERATFEFLRDRYEGEAIGEICEFVLQSSASREEAN
jgi:hypothetical protein